MVMDVPLLTIQKPISCWGILVGTDGAATVARVCDSSAVIQWLARKAMKRFLAFLINSDLWAIFASERGCFSGYILFLLLSLLFFVFTV